MVANAWTELEHPRPGGGADTFLNDVVVPAANDVWAVGYTFNVVGGALEFRTYGQHCVDGVCTRANLPNREGAPATNFLYGIGAFSPDDMWTVGYSRNPGQISVTLAIRYDRGTWRIVDTPNPAGSVSNVLYSVAHLGPDNAIAVGSYQDGPSFEERPMAMHWDGTAWSLLSVPAVPGCTTQATLYDVAAVGSATVMAGTCLDTAGADAGFILSRTAGGAWRVQVSPLDGVLPTASTLQSLAFVPGSGIWAVGTSNDFSLGTTRGITIRSSGGAWAQVPMPEVGTYIQPLAVAGIARNAVWAVGVTATSAFAERLSLYWNGRRYVDVPAGDYSNLKGVAYDPAGYWWSVGHDLGDSVIQRIASR